MEKKKHGGAMAMERYFSTDVLADILLRLPASSRRRARLVCRHWRDIVNERTTEMQSRPKVLLWNINYAVAHVSNYLLPSSSTTGSCTEIWRASDPWRHHYEGMELIGTCNGLLCLCDNSVRGSAFTLLNPATEETLAVPRLHCVGHHGWQTRGDSYSFAYHPITGRYKLVHVSGGNDGVYEFDAVYMLTIGEATWWKVPVGHGDATFNHAAGIVSVDGTTYWVKVTEADGIAKIVSFDLMDECVTSSTTPVPVLRKHYRLGEVHGRLGFVAWPNVWVLEEGQQWSHRYNFGTHGIPRPHFMYGEYILTRKGLSYYGHRTKGTRSSGWKLVCENVVRVGHRDEGPLVAKMTREGTRCFDGNYATFAYVETTEPLSIYAMK